MHVPEWIFGSRESRAISTSWHRFRTRRPDVHSGIAERIEGRDETAQPVTGFLRPDFAISAPERQTGEPGLPDVRKDQL
jgi:hypothetical protein